MRIGYLSSTFDLLNVSDLDVINQVRALCDRLIVGVVSDEYAAQVHGRPPIVSLEERLTLVRHVRGVDGVVVHDDVDLDAIRAEGTVYAVPGVGFEDHFEDLAPVTWVTPQRESTSQTLRDALRSVPRDAVA